MPVLGRATKSYAQRTGECGLDHAGIRAGVPAGVAPPRLQRACHRTSNQRGAQRHQHSGDPGRQIIGDIVQSGCRPTESEVAHRPIANHGVKGVDATVGEHPGHSGHRHPDQGRHGGIGGVLGHRLARRAHQSGAIEGGRISTAQRRQHGPRTGDITGLQAIGHRVSGRGQGGSAQSGPGGRSGQQGERYPSPGTAACKCACSGETANQNRGVHRARTTVVAIADFLKSRCAPTEPRHRMPAPGIGE